MEFLAKDENIWKLLRKLKEDNSYPVLKSFLIQCLVEKVASFANPNYAYYREGQNDVIRGLIQMVETDMTKEAK